MDINIPINDWKRWKGVCVICHSKIDTNKERYVKLQDYEGKKFISECFYHLNCWQNRFSVTQETINKMADRWLGKITHIAQGGKVIEIKN